ncbi:MAG: helix-turn-helix transcriptional regulator [Clostridia bacterium]|nr:helix-turn-helix transcriptional regulator [Clostridia bacterium]
MDYKEELAFYDVSFSKYRHTDNRRGSPYHYFAYMREGNGRILTEHEELLLEAGDFFYIPLNASYQSWWTNEGTVRFDSFGFKHFPLFHEKSYPLQKIQAPAMAYELNNKLYLNKNLTFQTISTFSLLVGCLTENMRTVNVCSKEYIVSQAEKYMAAHTEYHISDVARHCGISESGLYAAFRSERGYPPNAGKQKCLINRAIELLVSSDMTVDEISLQLGFHSPTYFRRIFASHTGKKPSEIRKERTI